MQARRPEMDDGCLDDLLATFFGGMAGGHGYVHCT